MRRKLCLKSTHPPLNSLCPTKTEIPSASATLPASVSSSTSIRRTTPPAVRSRPGAFAAAYDEYKALDVPVIGISRDSVASHVKFAEKYNLPFILLSDPELTAIQAYGVWQEKKMCGKVSMGVVRTTFIISADGKIEKIMPKVKPDTNAADVLEYLRQN